jgi:hypothetical protein
MIATTAAAALLLLVVLLIALNAGAIVVLLEINRESVRIREALERQPGTKGTS